VAVFLAIGGLLAGALWSSFFVANPAGMVQERRTQDGSSLIPQAEGAEIDSAALTPQGVPFLASVDTGAKSTQLAEDTDVLYGAGALKDPEQAIKTTTTAASNSATKPLAYSVIYRVAAGDTLASISTAFGVPINTIVEFNPSVNFSSLIPGISIVIPSQNDAVLFEG
jgi:LysM repeat protein